MSASLSSSNSALTLRQIHSVAFAARKIKMGRKKSEKSARSEDPDTEREGELFQPTGNFQADFGELCKEMEMSRPPPVLLRPKRPTSPVQTEHIQAPVSKRGKEDKKASVIQLVAEPEEETPEEKAVIEQFGFKPKTFSVKNYLDLMKPCVQVEMENPDRQDSVVEVFVKNWRLEMPMLRALGRCFEKLHRLHTVNFWRVAADASVIGEMAEMLRQLESLKSLSLEANCPVPEENFSELIRVDSSLTKLQLRFNRITDVGAIKIAEQLHGLRDPPSKLVSLDLSSNCVQDDGAVALAQALRTNRTMIHLSLSNNKLKDRGASALAQVCSRFFLTHEETVERRRLLSVDRLSGASVSASLLLTDSGSNSEAHMTQSSHTTLHSHSLVSSSSGGGGAHLTAEPPPSRRGAADRPGSVRSQEKADKKAGGPAAVGGGKTAGGPAAVKGKKDEKASKADEKTGGGKGKSAAAAAAAAAAGQKDEAKAKGKGTPGPPEKDAKGAPLKSGKGKGNRVKMSTPQLDPEPETQFDSEHPLLERADATYAPGYLLVPGNYVLAVLNLSRNQITDKGVQEWKTAVRYQSAYMSKQKVNGTGLLKLMLQGNPFSTESDSYQALEQVMIARDPLRPGATNSSGAE